MEPNMDGKCICFIFLYAGMYYLYFMLLYAAASLQGSITCCPILFYMEYGIVCLYVLTE